MEAFAYAQLAYGAVSSGLNIGYVLREASRSGEQGAEPFPLQEPGQLALQSLQAASLLWPACGATLLDDSRMSPAVADAGAHGGARGGGIRGLGPARRGGSLHDTVLCQTPPNRRRKGNFLSHAGLLKTSPS